VSVIDRVNRSWVNATYRFKTVGYQAILLSGVTPSNGSTGVPISTSTLGVNIIDTKGAKFNWTIKTSPNIGSSSGNNDINGSKSCSISGLAYSTTYYWYVNVSDGSLSTNAFYYFITQSEPSSPPPGPPPSTPPTSPPQNIAPTADANGPYYGYLINGIAKVTFDGSSSSGSITSYSWVFGDGKTGTGVSPTHEYTALGNYTVKITVSGPGGSDTDKTFVVISDVPNNPPTTPVVSGPQKGSKNVDYDYTAVSTDNDNDSIQYIFNWDDGSNTTTSFVANGTAITVSHNWSAWGIYTISVKAYDNKTLSDIREYDVLIDVIYIKYIGYLIDDDNQRDGYDTFYNVDNNQKTTVVKQEDGTYLINNDEDSDWDYIYDPKTDTLSEYSLAKGNLKADNNSIWYMLLAGIIMVVVVIAVIIVYLKKNYYI
jgi:PKD repeat protein